MKPRERGVNILLSIDQFNDCFSLYFGVMVYDVAKYSCKPNSEQLIYFYGLRKLCGLTHLQVSNLLGFGSSFESSKTVDLALKKLCPYDESYSLEFAENWRLFRAYCRLFRKPLTGAERSKRFREKQRNKKKRKGKE